jgi:pimeloyl-ACP methyl ester carboxylesterase
MLRETPVRIAERSAPVAVPRASGYADRAGRIPVGAAQVRIDRYRAPGSADRFEVYIGGTRDFSPVAGAEPWDMTSNLDASAGVDAGSVRVVREAMEQAGVTASTPVIVTGYSQGGLIAARLAASGDFDIRGLCTLGAPAGQVPVPPEIPWVAIEHTDDLVPAFGGTWGSAAPVIVRRQVFAGRPVDTSVALPAHRLAAYRETAAAADRSRERRLTEAIARLDGFADGAATVDSVLYRAERIVRRN